jgi:hypothetical protein
MKIITNNLAVAFDQSGPNVYTFKNSVFQPMQTPHPQSYFLDQTYKGSIVFTNVQIIPYQDSIISFEFAANLPALTFTNCYLQQMVFKIGTTGLIRVPVPLSLINDPSSLAIPSTRQQFNLKILGVSR